MSRFAAPGRGSPGRDDLTSGADGPSVARHLVTSVPPAVEEMCPRSQWFGAVPPPPIWNPASVERAIEIEGDTIRLGQLLKLAGAASGADAKALIANGHVTVNGQTELRRGRQLHPGDVVSVGRDALRIIAT
jgi:ribosome-associated protein